MTERKPAAVALAEFLDTLNAPPRFRAQFVATYLDGDDTGFVSTSASILADEVAEIVEQWFAVWFAGAFVEAYSA